MAAPSKHARKAARTTRKPAPGDGLIQLFGIHAVEAALLNPARRIVRVAATGNAVRKLSGALAGRGIVVEAVKPKDLDRRLPPDTVHQGVLAEVEPLPEPDLDDLAERAGSHGPVIVLDQVTDPHNVGAVLRSAAVFGAGGLIMTRRHSPPLTGTLAKSASGALELIPVALVQNLAKAMTALKNAGVTVLGLTGAGDHALEAENFGTPTALVLGAEGKGLRQLTAESCSRLVRISAPGALASLNVSNAAAIALHQAALKRRSRPVGD